MNEKKKTNNEPKQTNKTMQTNCLQKEHKKDITTQYSRARAELEQR